MRYILAGTSPQIIIRETTTQVTYVFAISAAILFYCYAGYPFWLALRRLWRRQRALRGEGLPSVSVLMAVRNEAGNLEEKIRSLQAMDYPPESLQIVIVSDGSTDATAELLERLRSPHLVPVILAQSLGKASALNAGLQHASGELLLMTDARQQMEPNALRELVAVFADPTIGAASGELMLRTAEGADTSAGLYWRIEKMIRRMESETGSVVGVTGAIYAIRRELMPQLPPGTILDDVFVPMEVVRQGHRVVFVPEARAWDTAFVGTREFRRKVRTLTGNYQLLQLSPWILGPGNPLWFEFLSHKLMRLVAPFALLGLLLSSAMLHARWANAALALQLAGYALAGLGTITGIGGALGRLAGAARAFVLLNSAAAVAFFYFVSRKREVWTR